MQLYQDLEPFVILDSAGPWPETSPEIDLRRVEYMGGLVEVQGAPGATIDLVEEVIQFPPTFTPINTVTVGGPGPIIYPWANITDLAGAPIGSVDARYLMLPPYRVTAQNPLGGVTRVIVYGIRRWRL